MDDLYARLESAVEQLRYSVLLLQQRVDTLESDRLAVAARMADAAEPDAGGVAPTANAPHRARRDPYDPIVVLTLLGRLFLVLAGGFFLRAMTEAGVLAASVGVGLAFVYALIWLVLADRASGRGQSSSALFHAIAAALVAFPLLVEGTTRFKVIGVGGSVLGLAILTIAFLGVAVRRKLHAVAWIAVVFALPTSAVLLLKTGVAAPFVLYLIALGVATVWLAYAHGWTLLRWPVALAADLAVVGATFRVLSPANAGESRVAVLLQVTLVAAYLGSIAVRTLLRDRNVTTFEVTQTVIALAVGFGGAVLLTRSNGTVPVLMGLASLGFGAACYALAFTFVGRHADHERNVHFYTSLALVLVLAGLALDLPGPWLGAVSASFAVLAAWAWSRYGRPDLLLHGTVYVVVAAFATGALRYATSALMASPERWVSPGTVMVTVAVATGITAFLAAGRPHPEGGATANGMRLLITVMLVWLASGCVTGYLGLLAAGPAEGSVNLGILATVRTSVLAGAALLVAAVARRDRFREWGWLVYPLLVVVGLKMVAQDFKYSRPSTLFIALALYGAALIVAPRLRRSGRKVPVQAVEA